MRPRGAVAKYLGYTLVADPSHGETWEWMEKWNNMKMCVCFRFSWFTKHSHTHTQKNPKNQQEMVCLFTWWLLVATGNCCGRCNWNLCQKEEKTSFYPIYGHHNFVQKSYFKKYSAFPGTTGTTSSKIQSYRRPKYSATVLIMKMGAQVSEYQHGLCLTLVLSSLFLLFLSLWVCMCVSVPECTSETSGRSKEGCSTTPRLFESCS